MLMNTTMINETLTMEEVFDLIRKERQHQKDKYGDPREQSVPGFLLIAEDELQEAKDGWLNGIQGKHSVFNELVQVAAVAVACLEKYGVDNRVKSTDDKII